MARTLEQLINLDDPGWPFVQELIAKATNSIEALPGDRKRGEAALLAIQVTTGARAPIS